MSFLGRLKGGWFLQMLHLREDFSCRSRRPRKKFQDSFTQHRAWRAILEFCKMVQCTIWHPHYPNIIHGFVFSCEDFLGETTATEAEIPAEAEEEEVWNWEPIRLVFVEWVEFWFCQGWMVVFGVCLPNIGNTEFFGWVVHTPGQAEEVRIFHVPSFFAISLNHSKALRNFMWLIDVNCLYYFDTLSSLEGPGISWWSRSSMARDYGSWGGSCRLLEIFRRVFLLGQWLSDFV